MRGLILAGGDGSRLASLGVAKPLIEIGGKPLVARLAAELDRLGCASILCMAREDIAGEIARVVPEVEVVACRTPSSLHTLALGLARGTEGPVLCSMVDTIMPSVDWQRFATGVESGLAGGALAVLAVTPFVDDESPVYVRTDGNGKVIELGDRAPDPVLVTGGAYGFAAAARAEALAAVERGEVKMRRFLRSLVERGARVEAIEIARIVDVDRPEDLELAAREEAS
jgi:choline kinase